VAVGAGPAGALVARQLACCGVKVLLVDRATFPRGKVCGCCLSGAALAALEAAGLGDLARACAAVPLRHVRLAAGRWSADVPLDGGVALSRERFDATLVEEAVRAGAAFLPSTWAALGGLTAEGRAVVLRQVGRTVTALAGVVLAADGLGGGLLARAGVADSRPAAGSRVGVGAVCSDGPEYYRPGMVYLAGGRHGYVGLVRLEDGRLDLAAALDADWLRSCGRPGRAVTALLDEAGWPAPPNLTALPWHGTPALTRHPRRLADARVFALGDAAGYVEPFTGEGIGWALSAAVALAPLAARAGDRWDPAFARLWQHRFHRVVGRQRACRALTFVLRRPRLARVVVAVLGRAPVLARPLVRRLNAPLVFSSEGRPPWLLPSSASAPPFPTRSSARPMLATLPGRSAAAPGNTKAGCRRCTTAPGSIRATFASAPTWFAT
jgi:flavin-dependent dehydrogenase